MKHLVEQEEKHFRFTFMRGYGESHDTTAASGCSSKNVGFTATWLERLFSGLGRMCDKSPAQDIALQTCCFLLLTVFLQFS